MTALSDAELANLEAALNAVFPKPPAGWTAGPTVRPKRQQVMRCFERGDVRALVFIAHKAGEDALCAVVAPKGRAPSQADLRAARAAFAPWGAPGRREDLDGTTLLYWPVSEIRRYRPCLLLIPGRARPCKRSRRSRLSGRSVH
jgi:hypothetical protein